MTVHKSIKKKPLYNQIILFFSKKIFTKQKLDISNKTRIIRFVQKSKAKILLGIKINK